MISCVCIVSLFSCYGDHPVLHSFPTRRSSDLLGLELVRADQVQLDRRHPFAHFAGGSNDLAVALDRRAATRAAHAQDRKSTRLNSSHVKISYAVFCLKKKKQHRRITQTRLDRL